MRVLIVDDVRLLGEALANILRQELAIEAVDVVADLRTPPACGYRERRHDVVLVSLRRGDGVQVLHEVRRAAAATPIITFAASETDDEIVACAQASVAGYLSCGETVADLVALIGSVSRGETWCSPRLAAALFRQVAVLASGAGLRHTPAVHLTPREREVLELVDAGMSNKEIARRLSIELRTVKNHVHHILEKLQVHRRAEAAPRFRATQLFTAPGAADRMRHQRA